MGLKGCKPEAWNASKGHTIEGSPHPSVLQTASFDYSYNTLSFCATKYYRRASNLICRKPLENGNFFVSSYKLTAWRNRADSLFLESDLDIEVPQVSDIVEKLYSISTETADAFTENQIDLSFITICHQSLKFRSGGNLRTSSGIIRIDSDIFPALVLLYIMMMVTKVG